MPFGCGLAVQRTAHLELRTACRFWRKRCCAPGIWCQGHLWLKSGAATQFILVAELLELKEHPGDTTGADWRLSLWRWTQA